MNIHEAAYKALELLEKPSHVKSVYNVIVENSFFDFGAKDPVRVLAVQIDRHARGVPISKSIEPKLFYRSAPATYGLLKWLDSEELQNLELDEGVITAIEQEDLDSSLFLEQELHRWLAKNLEKNGLGALGFGTLHLFDPERQEEFTCKFNTGLVGEIDMLLTTESGDFVIVELKRTSSDKTIGQMCRYFGWVKEHLATNGEEVFGVVLAQEINDQLKYAIKATNENITFRTLNIDVSLGAPSR